MKYSTVLNLAIKICFVATSTIVATLILSPFLIKNQNTNWPDTVSAIVALLAFSLALITYRNWTKQKIREDAYITTRSFISTLVSIEETIIDMKQKFYEITPKPGMYLLSHEQDKKSLNHLNDQRNTIAALALKLMSIRGELDFWGVSLTDEEQYNNTTEELNRYLDHSRLLINSLVNLKIRNDNDPTMIDHSVRTHDSIKNLFELFKHRKSRKMQNFFRY